MKRDDTIFDVGVHKGEDTAFYLKKGFRVIGFEAEPFLADALRQRFRTEIESDQFTLVEGAIASGAGDITFYRNSDNTQFGTLHPDWRHRNLKMGSEQQAVLVNAVNFADALTQFGVPHYMKIDIEGSDQVCLEALGEFGSVPDFLSLESDKTDIDVLRSEVTTLQSLGYTRFKAVQQRFIHRKPIQTKTRDGQTFNHRFEDGASGQFGDELAGLWFTGEELVSCYSGIFEEYQRWGDETAWKQNKLLKFGLDAAEIILGRPFPGWYDTHAAL